MTDSEILDRKHRNFSKMLTAKSTKEVNGILKALQRQTQLRSWQRMDLPWIHERIARAKSELEQRQNAQTPLSKAETE